VASLAGGNYCKDRIDLGQLLPQPPTIARSSATWRVEKKPAGAA